jgi:hypothetical protein
MMIIAADHPARNALRAGYRALAMRDRLFGAVHAVA